MSRYCRFVFAIIAVAAPACGVRTELPTDEAEGGRGVGGASASSATSSAVGVSGVGGAGGAGGAGGDDIGPLPQPTMLFVEAEPECAVAAPAANAEDALRPSDPGEAASVVELMFADECTGAGGQHVIMRTLDQSREFWLGAHACYFFDYSLTGPAFYFGVVRYSQTAALFHIDPWVCIGWPGEPPGLTSDSQVRAVGVFASLADAQTFAAAIE